MPQEKTTKRKIGRPVKIEGEKKTKEKIFDTAVNLFAESGYNRTSVRKIAMALNLTEGAVYRHYPSKEAILDEIFTYAEKQIFTPLPIEQTIETGKGMSVFRGLLEPLPEIILAEPYLIKIVRIMFHEMNHNEKICHYYQKEYIEKANHHVRSIFDKCVAMGTIKQCDTRALTIVFNNFRSEWLFQNFTIQQEYPPDLDKTKEELNGIIQFFEETFLPES
jgi:AcrR family transcriptional regulator